MFALRRAAKIDSKNAQILKAKAYAEYMCGNYEICKEDNEKAIELNEEDAYALRGYAVAVFRLGNKKEALVKMRKAAAFTSYADMDLMEDLRMMECINK